MKKALEVKDNGIDCIATVKVDIVSSTRLSPIHCNRPKQTFCANMTDADMSIPEPTIDQVNDLSFFKKFPTPHLTNLAHFFFSRNHRRTNYG